MIGIGYMVVVVGMRYLVVVVYNMVGLGCWCILDVRCIMRGLEEVYVTVVVRYIVVGKVDVGMKIVRWYHVVGHMVVDAGRSRNNPQTDMTCNFFDIDQDPRLGTHEVHRQLVLLVEHRDGGYSNARIRREILFPNH
jgi:hypothetical protein